MKLDLVGSDEKYCNIWLKNSGSQRGVRGFLTILLLITFLYLILGRKLDFSLKNIKNLESSKMDPAYEPYGGGSNPPSTKLRKMQLINLF